MPKTDWKACSVCGEAFDGAEYVQVEAESSRRVEGIDKPSFLQVITDADEDVARLHLTRQWYCGGWMKTRAVCLGCISGLPPEWRQLFERPDLSDWTPVRRLDSGDESSGSETWLVRRRGDPPRES
jgi:hypothetical protein